MSFTRFVYYSAILGGWGALLGWVVAELLVLGGAPRGTFQVAVMGGLVAAGVGAGVNLVAGLAGASWRGQLRRAGVGLVAGALGGSLGAALGNLLFAELQFTRALGWAVMGLAIGATDGIYERSSSKIRNGLIGGGLGGLLGGTLFGPIAGAVSSGSAAAARATAFVILGIAVGALIGLAQVVLRRAWLTVLDGFRPGRQLILSQPATVLGRGDHLPLPFIGHSAQDIDAEHVRISRDDSGEYAIEDLGSRLGTLLNGAPIHGVVRLKDGDLIRLGGNIVRFSQRGTAVGQEHTRGAAALRPESSPPLASGTTMASPPPPPVVPGAPPVVSGVNSGGSGSSSAMPPSPPLPRPAQPQPSQPPSPPASTLSPPASTPSLAAGAVTPTPSTPPPPPAVGSPPQAPRVNPRIPPPPPPPPSNRR